MRCKKYPVYSVPNQKIPNPNKTSPLNPLACHPQEENYKKLWHNLDKKRGQCRLALHLKTDVVGPHWDVLAVSQHSMERRAHQKQMIWWANNTVHLQGFSRQGSPYIGYVSIALFVGYVDILCIWTSSYTPILPIFLSIYWLEYWNICFGKDPR